jgi:hypothetical protein
MEANRRPPTISRKTAGAADVSSMDTGERHNVVGLRSDAFALNAHMAVKLAGSTTTKLKLWGYI